MPGLESIGKMLLIFGGALLVLGVLFVVMGRLPYVGRLPGDIIFQRGNFTFYFPVGTLILVSLALSILFNVILGLFR